jgi:hypothetical protein
MKCFVICGDRRWIDQLDFIFPEAREATQAISVSNKIVSAIPGY